MPKLLVGEGARVRIRFPATLSLVAVSLFASWMALESGGYFVTGWAPPVVVLAALLLFGSATGVFRGMGIRWSGIALGLFLSYAAWTFASIAWSPNRGDAWVGAGLTVLYLLAFWVSLALISAGASRRAVLAASAVGPAVVAAFVVWALVPGSEWLFEEGRLIGTVAYSNGAAASLLVPFWTAVYLAGSPLVAPLVRGLVLAGGVLCAEVCVLTQSRGAAAALAVSALVFFLLSGQRLRGLLALVPVCGALLFAFPALNEAYLTFEREGDAGAVLGEVVPILWLTTAAAFAYGTVWGIVDRRWTLPRRATLAAGWISLSLALVAVAGGAYAVAERTDGPVALGQQGWEAFKTQDDPAGGEESRYLGVSGSGRYELWQVAWGQFASHPVLGIGTHNYEAAYYRDREHASTGSVRQPHALPLEVLSERGIVGGVLFFGFLATCVAAGLRARLRRGLTSEGKAQVGALTAAVAYWAAHASAEWFWQLPAVTLPAMVYLAILVAPWRQSRALPPLGRRARAGGVTVAVFALACVLPLYAAERFLAQTYAAGPREGTAAAERAQAFNPIDWRIYRREAELAEAAGNSRRAEDAYLRAVAENPGHYAPHEILASFYEREGEDGKALEQYGRALELNPFSPELNRNSMRLLARAPVEAASVSFVDGDRVRARLDFAVAAGGAPGEDVASDAPDPRLADGSGGTLFAWPDYVAASFPAREGSGPVDVAFVAGGGEIVGIEPADPAGAGRAKSPRPYLMVLEAERGFFRDHGIGPGSRVMATGSAERRPERR